MRELDLICAFGSLKNTPNEAVPPFSTVTFELRFLAVIAFLLMPTSIEIWVGESQVALPKSRLALTTTGGLRV